MWLTNASSPPGHTISSDVPAHNVDQYVITLVFILIHENGLHITRNYVVFPLGLLGQLTANCAFQDCALLCNDPKVMQVKR